MFETGSPCGVLGSSYITEESLDPMTARVIADARIFFGPNGGLSELYAHLLRSKITQEQKEFDKFARPLLSIMTEQEIFRAFHRSRTDCEVLLIRI